MPMGGRLSPLCPFVGRTNFRRFFGREDSELFCDWESRGAVSLDIISEWASGWPFPSENWNLEPGLEQPEASSLEIGDSGLYGGTTWRGTQHLKNRKMNNQFRGSSSRRSVWILVLQKIFIKNIPLNSWMQCLRKIVRPVLRAQYVSSLPEDYWSCLHSSDLFSWMMIVNLRNCKDKHWIRFKLKNQPKSTEPSVAYHFC